jgi:hypothetical protein
MKSILRVGDVTATPGQMVTGFLEVSGTTTRMPLTLVNARTARSGSVSPLLRLRCRLGSTDYGPGAGATALVFARNRLLRRRRQVLALLQSASKKRRYWARSRPHSPPDCSPARCERRSAAM